MEVNVGSEKIASLMTGEMGIKEALIGSESIYTRPGGFFYLELNTKENENGKLL